jgi:hypothetical protein
MPSLYAHWLRAADVLRRARRAAAHSVEQIAVAQARARAEPKSRWAAWRSRAVHRWHRPELQRTRDALRITDAAVTPRWVAPVDPVCASELASFDRRTLDRTARPT